MKTKPCKCCEDKKSGASGGVDGYGFNRLAGEAREWAINNQLPRSEYCVPVKGGTRLGGPDWQKIKCGDGRMGFSTRRRGQDEVRIEYGLDGQWKRKRSTLLNKRSSRAVAGRQPRRVDGSKCCLVSSSDILKVNRDPVVVAKRERAYNKMNRKEKLRGINHNKVRRMAKHNHKAQLKKAS